VAVLMAPVISLMALWGFAAVTTAQSVSEVQQLKEVNTTLLGPIGEFISAVQAERTAAAQYLSSAESSPDALIAAGERTAETVAALRDSIARSSTDAAALNARIPGRINSLVEGADTTPLIHNRVIDRNVSWLSAFEGYTQTIRQAFNVTNLLTELEAPGVASDLRFAVVLSLAREMISREDAVMTSAYAAGVMTQSQLDTFIDSFNASGALLWTGADDIRPGGDDIYRDIVDGHAYQTLLGERVVAGSAGYTVLTEVPEGEWRRATEAVLRELSAGEAQVSTAAAEEASLFGFDVIGSAGVAVILGLVGVILALLISVLIGRGLVLELTGLHNSAMDLATRKLPATLRKLHNGDKVDLDTEAPRVAHGADEVSQVAQALGAVHRAAVQAAIERSNVLKGISGVYVFLARRSQILLHRQLALLDTMERRTDDPDQLEDLFRLDHLTTRMRRLTESLVILSGIMPARRWRNPVPLTDVVRAAVAEVEDFARVEVTTLPDIRIDGSAIADLTHLTAELVENAIVFSPPHTKALVRGELVGTGLVLEIEDRGLGMSPEMMDDANRRISGGDQIDLLETDQLGLFVVNRLSRRQNIEVTLQRSPYGGVTAIVLVPDLLLDKSQPHGSLPTVTQLPALTPAPASVGETNNQHAPAGPVAEQSTQPTTSTAVLTAPAPDPDDPADTADPTDLPRRVRQANLSPELRRQPGPRERTHDEAADERTPEQARATFAALRQGWLRGQAETTNDPSQRGHD
jgi:signal transduction histidine kinase